MRKAIIRLNDEIADRLRCQLVCAGYEFAEDFFCEVAALCHFQGRRAHEKSRLALPFNKNAFYKKHPEMKEKDGVNSPAYFRKYADFAYKKGAIIFL